MSTSAERMRRLRERRAAQLAPVPDPVPRDPADLLAPALETTLAALRLGDRDAAVAQLARRIAAAIDEAADESRALRVLGPAFLKVLVALHATPASRPAGKAGQRRTWLDGMRDDRERPNRVRELRTAHQLAKRKHGTPARGA